MLKLYQIKFVCDDLYLVTCFVIGEIEIESHTRKLCEKNFLFLFVIIFICNYHGVWFKLDFFLKLLSLFMPLLCCLKQWNGKIFARNCLVIDSLRGRGCAKLFRIFEQISMKKRYPFVIPCVCTWLVNTAGNLF